jgi:uncharacterized membrane protein
MRYWLTHSLRGVCMGTADLVPGVSGGTIALILGIYTRFIAALGAVGPGMLKALFTKAFWGHIKHALKTPNDEASDALDAYARHLVFLCFLVLGIGGAIVIGVRFIPDLLHDYPEQMNGLFFGLVLASVVIPFKRMAKRTVGARVLFVVALAATYMLVGLPTGDADRAAGRLQVTLSAALDAPLTLVRDPKHGPAFRTNNLPEAQDKREISFIPRQTTTIPTGTTTTVIEVIAKMPGTRANIEAKALSCRTPDQCKDHVVQIPNVAKIAPAGDLSGGLDPSLLFVFLAGMVAISAMVLPGISGSFILLLLGLYGYITFNLRSVIYERDPDAMVIIGIFLAAIVVGITLFSRVLNWLLKHHHDLTMAALIGLMVGSLRKLWPFTNPLPEGGTTNTIPATIDSTFWVTLALAGLGIILVLGIERLGRKREETPSQANTTITS